MRKTLIALLATAAFAAPAFAAPNASQQPNNPSQQQSQAQKWPNGVASQQGSNQRPVSPSSLSRNEIREMQTALNNDGFQAGRTDGEWGPQTRQAVQKFDQSKGIQAKNGRLTEDTLTQLGVNTNQQGQSPPVAAGSDTQNNSSH